MGRRARPEISICKDRTIKKHKNGKTTTKNGSKRRQRQRGRVETVEFRGGRIGDRRREAEKKARETAAHRPSVSGQSEGGARRLQHRRGVPALRLRPRVGCGQCVGLGNNGNDSLRRGKL